MKQNDDEGKLARTLISLRIGQNDSSADLEQKHVVRTAEGSSTEDTAE